MRAVQVMNQSYQSTCLSKGKTILFSAQICSNSIQVFRVTLLVVMSRFLEKPSAISKTSSIQLVVNLWLLSEKRSSSKPYPIRLKTFLRISNQVQGSLNHTKKTIFFKTCLSWFFKKTMRIITYLEITRKQTLMREIGMNFCFK